MASLLSCDMLPCLSSEDQADHRLRNAEPLGVLSERVADPPDFADVTGHQLGRVDLLAADRRPVPAAVEQVGRMGIPTEVVQPVIRLVAVLVATFPPRRAGA